MHFTILFTILLSLTQTCFHPAHISTSNIAEALDEGSMTALIILDLSAAFDVIDHPILLKRLEFSFSINDEVLNLG